MQSPDRTNRTAQKPNGREWVLVWEVLALPIHGIPAPFIEHHVFQFSLSFPFLQILSFHLIHLLNFVVSVQNSSSLCSSINGGCQSKPMILKKLQKKRNYVELDRYWKMQGKESGTSGFFLPDGVLQVLPSDPFEQLDVARKITSIALSTRVSLLESESSVLRSKLAEKDEIVADLRFQIGSLNASLSETADKLAQADEEKVWIRRCLIFFFFFCGNFIRLDRCVLVFVL